MKAIVLIVFSLFSCSVMAQSITIQGVVKSESGEPLIGVNVRVKGTSTGTTTKIDGSYELSVQSGNETLVFSFVGFTSEEISLNGRRTVNVSMKQDAVSLDAVTVTGFSDLYSRSRKRLESIQSIPESVIALSAEQIEATGVNDMGSFLTQVAGISYSESQNPGVVLINVRGIPQIRNGDSPIAVIVDGVYLADPNINVQSLYDIEQIEVVKGSQGLFYGKNAIGGAVNITTKQPGNEIGGKIKVGYGNGNSLNIGASVSGPITEDKVYFGLSGSYSKTDGLIKNTFLDELVDFNKDVGVRGLLKFELSDQSSLSLVGQYGYTKGGAIYFVDSNHNSDFPDLSPNSYTGSPTSDFLGYGTIKTLFTSAVFETNFDKFRLSSATSFTDLDRFHTGDFFSYGPVPDALQVQTTGSKTFNQELRLASTSSSKLKWNTGLFFQNSERPFDTEQLVNNDPTDFTYASTTEGIVSNDDNTFTSLGIFAFLEYDITDELNLSVGARNEFETVKNLENRTQIKSERSYSAFQPKVSLAYNFTKEIMVYTNYSGGFRSGGYNPAALAGQLEKEIRPEFTKSLEFGLKTSFAQNRIIFNAAAFSTIYEDQQAYRFGFGDIDGDGVAAESALGTVNLDEAKITGFEINAKFRVAKFLDITTGYSAIDSEITDAGTIAGVDASANNGNATPFTLKSSYSIGLFSNINLSDESKLTANVNVEQKGKKFWFPDNTYGIDQSTIFQDPFALVNTRVMVSIKDFTIGVWGKNIFGTEYNNEWWALSAFGIGDIRQPSQPATFGLDLSYQF